ncbi:hypothetical protein LRP49_04720 [Enterovibrio sp. ZSDZ35]|uniref:MORN repeat-containing protein n=1 Tax=Enterovibrio qingdaonensis TaxID=2899818 RepID=A0ABT5QI19_9GAMM|nr:hypothetical protein [Enterovibrio sp. ZSDZ35]MDD1780499.1 hypothetical protein [Enterovibrio sp. ZSDZ35]
MLKIWYSLITFGIEFRNKMLNTDMRCAKIKRAIKESINVLVIVSAYMSSLCFADETGKQLKETCSPIEYVENLEIGSWYYQGGFCNGLPHGIGTQSKAYVSLNGLYIKGTLVGRVIEQRRDGSRLVGPYVDGRRHGKFHLYESTEITLVQFYNHGLLVSRREPIDMAQSYVGEYDDIGQRSGKGEFIHPNSGIRYSGDWSSDMLNGQGEITFPDGSTYKGGFKDNRRSGFGIETLVDRHSYKGMWENGRMHGHGQITYTNGCKYTGHFANGRRLDELICQD